MALIVAPLNPTIRNQISVDVVNTATRRRMMAGIRSTNTGPEVCVRKSLHGFGFRFAHGHSELPGRPDLVLPRWRVAVFVNGCFWHLHGCTLSTIPSSNSAFWSVKLSANATRDKHNIQALINSGWRVLTVWECALRGSVAKSHFDKRMTEVATWIREKKKMICCELSRSEICYRKGVDESN